MKRYNIELFERFKNCYLHSFLKTIQRTNMDDFKIWMKFTLKHHKKGKMNFLGLVREDDTRDVAFD